MGLPTLNQPSAFRHIRLSYVPRNGYRMDTGLLNASLTESMVHSIRRCVGCVRNEGTRSQACVAYRNHAPNISSLLLHGVWKWRQTHSWKRKLLETSMNKHEQANIGKLSFQSLLLERSSHMVSQGSCMCYVRSYAGASIVFICSLLRTAEKNTISVAPLSRDV